MKNKAPYQPNVPLEITQGVEPIESTFQPRKTTKEVFDKFLKELEEGKVKGGVVYWPTAPKQPKK